MSKDKTHEAFEIFALSLRDKMTTSVKGEPEDQLRSPFETLVVALGAVAGKTVIATGEVALSGGLGKPDYAININGVLAGYVELKAPGKGADTSRYKSHDEKQWKKFSAIPNLLYTDGREWTLYRDGKPLDSARFRGDPVREGAAAVSPEDAHALHRVFSQFLFWQPSMPASFKEVAARLAPLCQLLRDDINEALRNKNSKLLALAKDWRKLLFPEATDARFADAYAQTITFALLLARLDGANVLDLSHAASTLKLHHTLLSRALQILTDDSAIPEIDLAIRLLQRTLEALQPQLSTGHDDPWLHFYEYFLAEYDDKLRKDTGAYYTPVEVVQCQVRLIDDLLRTHLNKAQGFASDGVVILDPAVGTGTYLLGVIEHTLAQIELQQGAGAIPAQATKLAENLFAFELMIGPFAVAELRLSRALADRKAALPKDGLALYLTDTLESPNAQLMDLPQFLRPISEQHRKALEVKNNIPVLVCLGNPPYDRHSAAEKGKQGDSGNWVRHGDAAGSTPILTDFIRPAKAAGLGRHLKNIYNLYVYFWRWSLWKVFERNGESGAGIVSFITASSYLTGPGFAGMREHMRRTCDEIWIIDLGGEGRGADKSDNVFSIKTPVAIGIAFRQGAPRKDVPAKVHYSSIVGSKFEKLKQLSRISGIEDLKWEDTPTGWLDKFIPRATGTYASWPLIIDLFPWQQPGCKAGRTWVIAPDADTLRRRWKTLTSAPVSQKSSLFKESPTGRNLNYLPQPLESGEEPGEVLSKTTANSNLPRIEQLAYRSFIRCWVIADNRVLDRPAQPLWQSHGPRQCFLTSLLTASIGQGPALTATSCIPDLDHFRGSFGAKNVIPLYRDSQATLLNLGQSVLPTLRPVLGRKISGEQFFAYCYAALAHPGFTDRFMGDHKRSGLRVPITRDANLFAQLTALGENLLWLHTQGERFTGVGRKKGELPQGAAKCIVGVPGTPDAYPDEFHYDETSSELYVGSGLFAPVPPEIWAFQVSGFKVVNAWLGYRMRDRKGKKSSSLDDIHPERWTAEFTTELLQLLWVLEATLDLYPELEVLLGQILASPLFESDDFAPPEEYLCRPPAPEGSQMSLLDENL